MTPRRPTRVHVTIDQVVLRGVPRGQEPAVVAALEQRLAALVSAEASRLHELTDSVIPNVRPPGPRSIARDAQELGARAASGIWSSIDGAS